ncbi:MAG: 50S ribosomal protein L29 [Ignavibacteriae bacterium HGW-Ignavibacteriae-3]|nr:MAG: 50S ribosomal protein L29 [Ignavibacteriae bacterium HGW-Ignavibacteriae-3]
MKIFEIREMSTEEIKKRILEDQKNLVDLRFQQELKNLTNTAKLHEVRKDVAKLKTILKEREMQEAKTSKAKK